MKRSRAASSPLVRLPSDVTHHCASFLDVFDLPALFDTARSVRVMVIGYLRAVRHLRLLQEVRGPAGAIDPASRWLRLLSAFTRNLHILDLHGTRWTTNPGGGDLLVPVIRANCNTLRAIDGVEDFSGETLTALLHCPELRRIGPPQQCSDILLSKCRKLESLSLHREADADFEDMMDTTAARLVLRDLALSRLHLTRLHPSALSLVVPTNLTELSLDFTFLYIVGPIDLEPLIRLVAEAPSLRIFRLLMHILATRCVSFDLPNCEEVEIRINAGLTVPTFRAPRLSKLSIGPAVLANLDDLAVLHPNLTDLTLEVCPDSDSDPAESLPVLPHMTSFRFAGSVSPTAALCLCAWQSLTSLSLLFEDHPLATYAIAILLSSLPSLVTANFEAAFEAAAVPAKPPLPKLIALPTLTDLSLLLVINDDRLFAALHTPHLTKLNLRASVATTNFIPFLSRCPALIDLNAVRVKAQTDGAVLPPLSALRRLDCRDASPSLASTLLYGAPFLTALRFGIGYLIPAWERVVPVIPASVEDLLLGGLTHYQLSAFRLVLQQLPHLRKLNLEVDDSEEVVDSFKAAVREICPLVNLVLPSPDESDDDEED